MKLALGKRVRLDVGHPGANDGYRAEWHPYVSTTPTMAKVYIVKAAVPGQRLVNEHAKMFIAQVDNPDADDFDDRLVKATDKATLRASTMSTTQNAINQYDMGIVLHKHWKLVMAVGVVIGMALPNIPGVPIF